MLLAGPLPCRWCFRRTSAECMAVYSVILIRNIVSSSVSESGARRPAPGSEGINNLGGAVCYTCADSQTARQPAGHPDSGVDGLTSRRRYLLS